MVNDKMLCEDIVQNTFLKLFENLDKIENMERVNYWLITTARNEVYTHFRGKKAKVDQFNVIDADELKMEDEENLVERIELKETKEIILKELDTMAPEQREVFILKEYSGMSYKEIASIMNIDENLVKSRLFKTRQKLINRIAKLVK